MPKKRADGRYVKIINLGRRPDGTYIRKNVYARTKKELEEKVAKIQMDLKRGSFVEDDRMTFQEMGEIWINRYKNGIAEILTAAEELLANPEIKHGKIMIGFTPDEEIGRGANRFDLERFGADYAYTLDGGAFGEVECETFNAAHAHIAFNGISVHPGSAKDKMVNAALVAMEFDSLLPEVERPCHTSGYDGFYHLTGMKGTCDNADLYYIIRDHDSEKLTYRVEYIKRAADEINRRYGEGTAVADVWDQYYNMYEKLKDHMEIVA